MVHPQRRPHPHRNSRTTCGLIGVRSRLPTQRSFASSWSSASDMSGRLHHGARRVASLDLLCQARKLTALNQLPFWLNLRALEILASNRSIRLEAAFECSHAVLAATYFARPPVSTLILSVELERSDPTPWSEPALLPRTSVSTVLAQSEAASPRGDRTAPSTSSCRIQMPTFASGRGGLEAAVRSSPTGLPASDRLSGRTLA